MLVSVGFGIADFLQLWLQIVCAQSCKLCCTLGCRFFAPFLADLLQPFWCFEMESWNWLSLAIDLKFAGFPFIV